MARDTLRFSVNVREKRSSEAILSKIYTVWVPFCVLLCVSLCAKAQFKTELINYQGATAPCVGVGPVGGPAVKKCVELFEQAGFLREQDLGYSGIVLGLEGKDDGLIVRIDPGSPAEQSGLAVGDAVVAVEGKPVKPTAATIAAQRLFGEKKQEVTVKFLRAGAETEVKLVRDAAKAVDPPKSPNFFMTVRPLVNWKGEFIPCLGVGPASLAATSYCASHFKPFGYVKVGEMGGTGIKLDPANNAAIISDIDPASPAAKANLKAGDEITAIDGKPLTASVGEWANQKLFAKVGDPVHVTVHRSDADKTVTLALIAKPNGKADKDKDKAKE